MRNIPDRINSRYRREKIFSNRNFQKWNMERQNKKKGITTSVSSVHPREKIVKYLRNKD